MQAMMISCYVPFSEYTFHIFLRRVLILNRTLDVRCNGSLLGHMASTILVFALYRGAHPYLGARSSLESCT